jgi:hypothetical protein
MKLEKQLNQRQTTLLGSKSLDFGIVGLVIDSFFSILSTLFTSFMALAQQLETGACTVRN